MIEALALGSGGGAPFSASASMSTVAAFAACEVVLFGGCALSSHAFESLSSKGVKLASQYGQTEVGGMVLLGEPPLEPTAGARTLGAEGGEGGGCRRSEMRPVAACG
jgi:acyl-coenzyme A synthetase/AMP-(fatty) acid ligase